ncbi:Protein of unknown function [Pyronema omphalodes CBS 100304]|uniref:Uncharacterized protein n=1 Tax=Pyronema omphalodes (strain CBS 100304) TaxID=1076935 RepID=U4LD92_PYROM|nr:Protein of unknown function [Pyronema omphalodes CBS 100304]
MPPDQDVGQNRMAQKPVQKPSGEVELVVLYVLLGTLLDCLNFNSRKNITGKILRPEMYPPVELS